MLTDFNLCLFQENLSRAESFNSFESFIFNLIIHSINSLRLTVAGKEAVIIDFLDICVCSAVVFVFAFLRVQHSAIEVLTFETVGEIFKCR